MEMVCTCWVNSPSYGHSKILARAAFGIWALYPTTYVGCVQLVPSSTLGFETAMKVCSLCALHSSQSVSIAVHASRPHVQHRRNASLACMHFPYPCVQPSALLCGVGQRIRTAHIGTWTQRVCTGKRCLRPAAYRKGFCHKCFVAIGPFKHHS